MSADDSDDAELVLALGRGERAAFDAIYDRHRARVFSFLLRMGGDHALAEDLMQETFVRLATKSRSLAPDTRLRPWLFTVARNLFFDRRRRSALGRARLKTLGAEPPSRSTTPLEAMETSERAKAVTRALQTLKADQREAILLCTVEGFSPAEAAGLVGVAPAAMRQRLARARRTLRELLERTTA
ncbi:MAG: RNA polymerase sigma factor [Deltaproteobacteria bacterium]|nr:RNA polymerase sigma factor [Deltaproteobacteria bacterium]